MSGRGHERLRHRGLKRDGWLLFFFLRKKDLLPSEGGVGGPYAANPLSTPLLDEDMHSDDDLIREIENYTKRAKGKRPSSAS